jgi:hypothetical protein
MLPAVIAALVPLLARTWRVTQPAWPVEGPCVVAFWHGDLLPMIALHRAHGMTGLASRSRDGELVAAVLTRLGYGVLRGSSSRGGVAALRGAEAVLRGGGRVALAVDGPRGPRHAVQPGAEGLAERVGCPVVFGAIEAGGIRLRTWDRFVVPPPGARVAVRYGTWRPGEGSLAEAMLAITPEAARHVVRGAAEGTAESAEDAEEQPEIRRPEGPRP